MELIPITKLPISKEKWLSKKIKYENDLSIFNILIVISQEIYSWINCNDDIIELLDHESFNQSFVDFCYQASLNNINYEIVYDEDYEFFELKYLEEINEIFLKIKDNLDILGVYLFTQNHFMDLFEFIYQNIHIIDDDEHISENEFNNEEINSMLYSKG
jgi:hypothetical protein